MRGPKPGARDMKLKHWRAFSDTFAWRWPSMLEFNINIDGRRMTLFIRKKQKSLHYVLPE
jgi:hypothetical protein